MIRRSRSLRFLPGVLAALAIALAAATSAGAATGAGAGPSAGADADLAALMKKATVPAAAAVPGGRVTALAPAPLADLKAAGGVTVKSPGCAAKAAQLKAGTISSYTCTTARVIKPAVGAAVTWPSACSSGTGTLTGWIAVDRRNACDHDQIGLTTIQMPSGKVIGTTNLHAVNTMSASTSAARWSDTNYMWVWGFTGVGFPEFATGLLFGTCPGCLASNTWTPGSMGDSWRGVGTVNVTGMAAGAIVNNVGGFWEVTLGGAGWGNDVVIEWPLATSRCDNAIGNRLPGCVFGNIPSVVGFSQATVPEFVTHVYGAQVSGLPGRLSTGTYLSRITNSTLISKNGSKACPSTLTRPTGYQCDEYPFRSVQQGAYTSGATLARSQPQCRMPDPARTGATGWSRCFILSGQNLSAGGTLGAFYGNERMLTGDLFQVGYLP